MPQGIFKNPKERSKKISDKLKGKLPWNKEIIEKMRKNCGHPMSEINKRKMAISNAKRVGELSATWKGGITPIHQKIRNSKEYADWRTAVFQRDDYTCQECGSRGYKLNADHIKPFTYFPELRLVIENGRTLCVPCHRKTPTYAGRARLKIIEEKITWQKI